MVKHEQSQEPDNCDYLQILWSIIFSVTGVVNYSVEKTMTWWARCWPFSSGLQNKWNTRREWINLFINEIKFKTLQFVFAFLASSILFHKKSFILWVHDCLPTYIFSLILLLAHIKLYLFIRQSDILTRYYFSSLLHNWETVNVWNKEPQLHREFEREFSVSKNLFFLGQENTRNESKTL